MVSDLTAIAALLGMTVVTLLNRVSGLWLMSHVPLTGRVRAFLQGMSGAVLVALVVPGALHGDWPARAGVTAAAALMWLTGRTLLSMFTGVAVTAALRLVWPT